MDNTEELIPLLLPDDEEGFSWTLRYVTKEEADLTIETAFDGVSNFNKSDISKEIIENNVQSISELGYQAELTHYDKSILKHISPSGLQIILTMVMIVVFVVGLGLYNRFKNRGC